MLNKHPQSVSSHEARRSLFEHDAVVTRIRHAVIGGVDHDRARDAVVEGRARVPLGRRDAEIMSARKALGSRSGAHGRCRRMTLPTRMPNGTAATSQRIHHSQVCQSTVRTRAVIIWCRYTRARCRVAALRGRDARRQSSRPTTRSHLLDYSQSAQSLDAASPVESPLV